MNATEEASIAAIRAVPRTGVIYVTTEASRRGFSSGDPLWCNLGQGQPEAGELEGAPARITEVRIDPGDQEYAPIAGITELREAVAAMYNRLFRRGLASQYTAENVAISSGGRAALTRAAASIGQVNLGHFLPDYTAYEELLDIFRAFTAIPILLDRDQGYSFSVDDLRREVRGRGLAALLMSNPCNPSGKLVQDEQLEAWVGLGRQLDCMLLVDEFYSHYVWTEGGDQGGQPPIVSAARYVSDVDRDPVLIFDGLTKNWRYPGWRVAWTVGPKHAIESLCSAGSFLDGGGSRMMQRAAVPLLEHEHVMAETGAIQRVFRAKRDRLVERLAKMGITTDRDPEGSFYIWGRLADLPAPLNDGMGLFHAALKEKVITVPGMFFDVNPGKRRNADHSRFRQYARFSFGPVSAQLELACDRLDSILSAYR